MDRIRLLDEPLLREFERVLARQAGDLLRRTPPGRSDAAIAAKFATSGLTPTLEARLWWAWRDGSSLELLPGLGHISLAAAFEGADMLRRQAVEAAEEDTTDEVRDPDNWWKRSWVPIFDTGGQPKIAIDCSGPPDAPSPLRQIDWPSMVGADPPPPFAYSLGDYIAQAVRALDADRYHYDPGRNTWLPTDWASVPAGRRF